MTRSHNFPSELSSVEELGSQLDEKMITHQDLFSACLDSMNETARDYGHILFTDEDALDKRGANKTASKDVKRRSLLDGIPILIKDNIDTSDMPTTAGSTILAQLEPPKRDASIVSILRNSGAVIAGKTNLSEWSNFRGLNSISGWSGVGGQCKNAVDPTRSPGGSSSGSAVAVALGVVRVAIGTETDGSLMCPAAFNGVVALKPTHGLISTEGVVPIAKSQDTVGPIGRSVLDVASAFITMSLSNDPFALLDSIKSYAQRSFTDLKRPKVAVATDSLFGYHQATDAIIYDAIETLNKRLEVVMECDKGKTNSLKVSDDLEYEVLISEFAFGIERYMSTRITTTGRSLEWLVSENEKEKHRELVLFGQELFEDALTRRDDLSSPRYLQALTSNRSNARKKLSRAFAYHDVDVIVAPTTSPSPLIDDRVGDFHLGSGYSIAAVGGYPSLTLPAGYVNDLPVGLLLIGKPYKEIQLLSIAAVMEDMLSFQLKPKMTPL